MLDNVVYESLNTVLGYDFVNQSEAETEVKRIVLLKNVFCLAASLNPVCAVLCPRPK